MDIHMYIYIYIYISREYGHGMYSGVQGSMHRPKNEE